MNDRIDLHMWYKMSGRNLDTRDRVLKLANKYLDEGNHKKYELIYELYTLLCETGEELLDLV